MRTPSSPPNLRPRLFPALLILALSAALAAPAGAAAPAQIAGLFDRPVGIERLAQARGGFAPVDGGLIVSFGIQRAVLVDGVPIATAADGATLLLVQTGRGNGFSVSQGGAAAVGTVLQNTLDNQKLQTVTTLDVTATSLQAFRGLAWQSTLRSAITESLRH